MRNLKRALSLALASVMAIGMMVVGTGAAYTDVSSDKNVEAIEVLQAVGVMVGDENGNFNPDKNVTRNEMAVIMANLMDYNVATYKGTSPFTDVPSWAEPYVAACYTNGITSGTSATTYGGDQGVTTAQASLMLMKALGYFQYQSDFKDDWQLATASQGNKISLYDKVDSGLVEAMTRNDVAQLVLNTLESGTVEAEKTGSDIVMDNVTIVSNVKYNYVTSGKDYASAIDSDLFTGDIGVIVGSGNIVQLGEKLYNGSLKLQRTSDDFGAPSSLWLYNNKEVGNYADTPDYTFSGVVKSNVMYSTVGKNASTNYGWAVYMDADGNTNYIKDADGLMNDPMFAKADVVKNDRRDLAGTVRGSVTNVYVDDDAKRVTVCVMNTYIGEVTKVETENGITTITVDDKDEPNLTFDIEGYSEGDMILYTRSGTSSSDYAIQTVLGVAETFEGEIETVRDQDRIIIDGTTYRYSYNFNNVNDDKLLTDYVNETVSFYLDQQGNIIAFDETAANLDYAFVYSIGSKGGEYDDTKTDIGAKLVLTDGTVKNVTLNRDDVDTAVAAEGGARDAACKAYFGWKIVSYSENDDGTYSLGLRTTNSLTAYGSPDEDIVKNGNARVALPGSGNYVYADKNTVFLINQRTDDGDEFNAYIGYENVPNVDALSYSAGSGLMGGIGGNSSSTQDGAAPVSDTGIAVYKKSGVAKVVVITDADVTGSANDVVFVVGDTSAKLNKTGSTEYYVYDAVVNGEVTSLKVKADSEAYTAVNGIASKEIGVFFGLTKNSAGYVTKVTTTSPKDVQVNGDQNRSALDGGTYLGAVNMNSTTVGEYVGTKRESNGGNVTFDTANVGNEVSLAANPDAVVVYYNGTDLTVASRVSTDVDDRAMIVTDDGELIAVVVREFIGGNLAY